MADEQFLKEIDYIAFLCNKDGLPCYMPPYEGRMLAPFGETVDIAREDP
jgi:hypothetical protein